MSLSDAQIDHFRTHGYTAVPNFFSSREVRALQVEVERFKRQGLVRNVATDGDGSTHSTTKTNLQLIPLNDKSDLIRALPFEEKTTAAEVIQAYFRSYKVRKAIKGKGKRGKGKGKGKK